MLCCVVLVCWDENRVEEDCVCGGRGVLCIAICVWGVACVWSFFCVFNSKMGDGRE